MQVYLVGGAVRDELLGRPVTERDWVVVGATPEQMLRLGYRPVGREFPVFLHPETKQEYALARLERKTAPGYRGFVTEFSPSVSLEQDLARFAELGFEVAPATRVLMQTMAASGEIAALVPERVWREMERALGESAPQAFFDTLRDCGALALVLPELRWEPAARAALAAAVRLTSDTSVRFAALMADAPVTDLERLCERLRVPGRHAELALLCARLWKRIERAPQLDAEALLDLLEEADAMRRPERFDRLLQSAAARSNAPAAQELLQAAAATAGQVTLEPALLQELSGPAIGAAFRAARIERLAQLQSERRRS
jgi:tRNA nucleotidyltransferase (CCA-adding enzyme)